MMSLASRKISVAFGNSPSPITNANTCLWLNPLAINYYDRLARPALSLCYGKHTNNLINKSLTKQRSSKMCQSAFRSTRSITFNSLWPHGKR